MSMLTSGCNLFIILKNNYNYKGVRMPNAERITQIHNYYMNIALLTSSLSYCCRLKVGAIAVKDGRIISTGYNGTPSGWDNFCEDDINIFDRFQKKADLIYHQIN